MGSTNTRTPSNSKIRSRSRGPRVELDRIGKPGAAAAHHAQAQAALFGRNAFLGHGHANPLDRTLGHLQALAGTPARQLAAGATAKAPSAGFDSIVTMFDMLVFPFQFPVFLRVVHVNASSREGSPT